MKDIIVQYFKNNLSIGWSVTWRVYLSVFIFTIVLSLLLIIISGPGVFIIGIILIGNYIVIPIWGYNYWGKSVIKKRLGYSINRFIGLKIYLGIIIVSLFINFPFLVIADNLPRNLSSGLLILIGGISIIFFIIYVLFIVAFTGSLTRKEAGH